ncbi:DNA-methyltransferase [Patescibacteria group bacterium]
MSSSRERRPRKSVKRGDVFALGRHRLLCGDATDAKTVGLLVGGGKIDLILTDPPYGVDYVASKRGIGKVSVPRDIANDGLATDDQYRDFTRAWLEAAVPHLAPKNAAYVFNSDRMVFALREGMLAAGFKVSQLLVWAKTHSVVGRLDYQPQHELIAYGWRGRHEFRKSKDKSVLVCPKPQKSGLHPTMKPVALLRRLVLNSSKLGGTVYDPFGGSGSTLIACEQTRRACLTIELDPKYCRTIVDRFEKLTGVTAKKL